MSRAKKIEAAILAEIDTVTSLLIEVVSQQNGMTLPCSVRGCVNRANANGLCNAHYLRAARGLDLGRPVKRRRRNAVCAECDNPVGKTGGWGLCKKHYRLKRRRVIRRACIEALGGKCMRCRKSYPDAVFDFHHRDPSDKYRDPSGMIENNSIKIIAIEVSKCDLLCANCHRIEHHGE